MDKKTILIGLTGSIAVFKILELVKKLKANYNVEIIYTQNAKNLINIKEFEKLCTVHHGMFVKNKDYKYYLNKNIKHIGVARMADLFLIAPCTANVIAKLANGIADDFLTTTALSTTAPLFIAPAMNHVMYNSTIVQENIVRLKKRGINFIGPAKGHLACGETGEGRLADIAEIEENINLFFSSRILEGKKVLITAGPTIEKIDPVRYISNSSSGKMGYALAKTAKMLGADVTLISGYVNLENPIVNLVKVSTAEEMLKQCLRVFNNMDIIICSAAVCDFKPEYNKNKIKKQKQLNLKLRLNPDILHELGRRKKSQILVGFALETENMVNNARKKLAEKNLDLIIANNGSAIGSDNAEAVLITKDNVEKLPLMNKLTLAKKILEKIAFIQTCR